MGYFIHKFSKNSYNELKITKIYVIYGSIQTIREKGLYQNCRNFWNNRGSVDFCILY
ncbi:hypothetical protein NMT12_30133 [metagenome]